MKPLIVHLSADYPDAIAPGKTRAIERLVTGMASRFAHRVYSLNRRGGIGAAMLGTGGVEPATDDGMLASWTYRAPPAGLAMRRAMSGVAGAVLADLAARGLEPAIIQGHKLSFEGIAARQVARSLGVPFAVTLQGNTDRKVLRARPDLAGAYRSVWHEAEAVFAFAPWIADWCSERLGRRGKPPISLPCITNAQQTLAPQTQAAPRVVSAFNLDDWRNKNVASLVEAMAKLRKTLPEAWLEIAGSGSGESQAAVDAIIRDAGAGGFVRRIGSIAPASIQQWMNGAAAFAMPSQRESFGMVFVEALLSGCPIVYSRGTAVDGYFPGAPFARACDPGNASDIAANLGAILESRAEAVSALERWQAGEAQRFLAPAILKAYGDEMERLADGAAGED